MSSATARRNLQPFLIGDRTMPNEKRTLVDVGMKNLTFPMKVSSRRDSEGQASIANISISARIMHEFEARWIDKFIQILHRHRDEIGTATLRKNIIDYSKELNASSVRISFAYPFFVEKLTLVSKQKCLVRYHCTYSAKTPSIDDQPKITLAMDIPVITTDPASIPENTGGLLGQLSVVTVEVQSREEVFPEDIVELVDKHALSPTYSFLTPDDQIAIIQKVHSQTKSSVVMTDEIKNDLVHDPNIIWYSVKCANFATFLQYFGGHGNERLGSV